MASLGITTEGLYFMRDERAAKQNEVFVDHESCIVWSAKTGKSTWRAYGNFRDHPIDENGRTESEALSRWKKRAEYHASE